MPSVAERIKRFRERLSRRQQAIKARQRARARSRKRGPKAREQAERERRIERNEPESLSEAAAAAGREARETASTAADVGSAATEFVASELGVSREDATSLVQSASSAIDSADTRRQLDIDGDGDTDILPALEGDGGLTDPVVEVEATPEEPVLGITDEQVDLGGPVPGEQTGARTPGEVDF